MCPTQHIDCSLMHDLISLSHKNFQLLLGMYSSNKHQIMFKWGIFNASVLLNEHGHPHFLFQNWSSHIINIQWATLVWTKSYWGITLKQEPTTHRCLHSFCCYKNDFNFPVSLWAVLKNIYNKAASINGHKIRRGRQCLYLQWDTEWYTQLWLFSSSCSVESPLKVC